MNERLRALQDQVNSTLQRYVEYVERVEAGFDEARKRLEENRDRLKTITDAIGTTNVQSIADKITRLEAENARLRERLGE